MKNSYKSVFTLTLAFALCATAALADEVVVANPKSGLAELSKQEVADLFLGKRATFPDGRMAVPLDHAEGTATREDFHNKFTGKSPAQLKAYWSKQVFSGKGTPPKEVPGSADAKKLVAENPSMIAYIEKSLVDASVKVVAAP